MCDSSAAGHGCRARKRQWWYQGGYSTLFHSWAPYQPGNRLFILQFKYLKWGLMNTQEPGQNTDLFDVFHMISKICMSQGQSHMHQVLISIKVFVTNHFFFVKESGSASQTLWHIVAQILLSPYLPVAEIRALEKKKNKSFSFPWYGVIFGYILVGVCIVNGGWWSYLYSMQWGKEISNSWLMSLALSLFTSILVMQPLKVRIRVR